MAYRVPDTRRHARQAVLAALALGVVRLAAACGGASSPSSAAAGATATPRASATSDSPAATSPSASAAATSPSASPSRSPAVPSASPVTAGPAGATQIAEFTAAANRQCGVTRSVFKLTDARVTSNGWGSATVTADNPADEGNASMIFQIGSAGWMYVECGSDFTGSDIPQDVLKALFG